MNVPYIDYNKSHRLREVDSTNNFCRSSVVKEGEWVTADIQLNGRGRGSNKWESLGEGNIYFSAKIKFELNSIPSLPFLSLLIGSAVLKTIKSFAKNPEEFSLKWPNDIYKSKNKIAGILLEASTGKEQVELILGIGINLSQAPNLNFKNYAVLYETEYDSSQKEKILQNLIENLNLTIQKIYTQTTTEELSWIVSNSYLRGKIIQGRSTEGIVSGSFAGYTEDGFLLLKTESGTATIMDTDSDFKFY